MAKALLIEEMIQYFLPSHQQVVEVVVLIILVELTARLTV
jgi:hypothetical protein